MTIYDIDGNILNCNTSYQQNQDFIRYQFTYNGEIPVHLGSASLTMFAHNLNPDSTIYAEAYNMLSQTLGTLANPVNMTDYSDAGHYKLPTIPDFFTAYSMLVTTTVPATIFAYTSTDRFVGKIHFNATHIILEQDLCGILIQPGESILLEEYFIQSGDKNDLLNILGTRLSENHNIPKFTPIPTGWCSWYCYGPDCTSNDFRVNMLSALEHYSVDKEHPFLMQIDDGFQEYMGDFLSISDRYPDFEQLNIDILSSGYQSAIWVAPFIAEPDSRLFQEHPDYFVKDIDGNPLCSLDCTFEGWRCTPWYMLDGTNPAVLTYLTNLFQTLRNKYGYKYFKLDANMWGALPFGNRYDNTKTYVEAYRNAMNAIIQGAGEDSYILGCNAPMWPSIGVVHGMRVGGDISRSYSVFKSVHNEISHRNWQHDKLWLNDPDCVVTLNNNMSLVLPDGTFGDITSDITAHEFAFHRTSILASGGIIMFGDAICDMTKTEHTYMQKLMNAPKVPAIFDDIAHTVGRQVFPEGVIITLFQPADISKTVTVTLDSASDVYDFWNDELLFSNVTTFTIQLNAHEGRAFYCK